MENLSVPELVNELEGLAGALKQMAEVLQRQEAERRRTEQQLVEALELNQKIIAASLLGMAAYDATGQCILANEAAARIIGATVDQVLAQNFCRLESWRKSGLLDAAKSALASGEAQRIEVQVVSSFGKALWLDCYFIPFARAEDRHLLLMFHDITRRKQTEINLNALYAITSTTGHSLALSEVLEQALSTAIAFLGFDAGAVLLADESDGGLRLAAARNLPPALMEYLQQANLQGTLCAHVYQMGASVVIGDAERADVSDQLRPFIAEVAGQGWRTYAAVPLVHHEQPLGVLSLAACAPRSVSPYDEVLFTTIGHQVATAVAHARAFESTLRERTRLQALVMASRDGIILVGMDGRLLTINAAALQLLRLAGQPRDWQGRSLREMLAALRRTVPAALSAAVTEARRLRRNRMLFGEGEIEAPPHVFRWVHLPVTSGHTLQGRLILLYDVSEARAVERLRDDMIYTLVHDLRNPLSNIATSLGLLMEGAVGQVSPDQCNLLNIAQLSVNNMLMLVNAILDVGQLESKQMPVLREAFDLHAVVAETLRMQAPLIKNKDLRVENQVPTDLPAAWADVRLIRRVLQNLVGNALKFTPTGGAVRVTAHLEESPRSTLLVSISDSGPGIPPQMRERLFQKFVVGQQPGRGSGLGLAFCKLALEVQGEHIWVESTPGAGATFTFTLAVASQKT